MNIWLVAVVGLAAALLALGSWVLVDRYGGGGGATHDATTLIDNFTAAANADDLNAIAALLAKDVQVRSLGDTTAGADTVAMTIASAGASGLHVERAAPVTVEGQFATTFNRYTYAGQTGTFLAVFQLKDGKILRLWVYEPGVTAPFENAVRP